MSVFTIRAHKRFAVCRKIKLNKKTKGSTVLAFSSRTVKQVDLVLINGGTKSNRDGLGATLLINGRRYGFSSAVGYASSVLQGVHVGLGASTAAPRIEVRWPSGRTQAIQARGVDQVVEITEPEA